MELVLIAAVARNGAIGRNNELLFREPADQKFFRDTTMGHPVLMGRKTWDSLPARFRPLPGRRNIVLSRDAAFQAEGAESTTSLEEALQRVAQAERVFVIGGAQIYALALPLAHTLLLTEVDADLAGDSFFPAWDRHAFERTAHDARTSADGVHYAFTRYDRRSPASATITG